MILKIILQHSFFGGETEEQMFIGPDELDAGADIASHLFENDRILLSPFTAEYIEEDTVKITCRDKSSCFSIWKGGFFKTPYVSRPSKNVQIEGTEYENDHEIRATVTLLPHIQAVWDILKVVRESETVLFRREQLKPFLSLDNVDVCGNRFEWLKNCRILDVDITSLKLRFFGSEERDITLDCFKCTEVEDGGLVFSLISNSSVINE